MGLILSDQLYPQKAKTVLPPHFSFMEALVFYSATISGLIFPLSDELPLESISTFVPQIELAFDRGTSIHTPEENFAAQSDKWVELRQNVSMTSLVAFNRE